MANNDVLDFNATINEGEPQIPEEGQYFFKVKSVEDGVSKSSGAPMVSVELMLFNGDLEYVGKVYDHMPLIKAAVWKICAFYRTIGLKKHGQPIQMNWPWTVNRYGYCEVIHDSYNGQKRVKVSGYIDREAMSDIKLVAALEKAEKQPAQQQEEKEEIPF